MLKRCKGYETEGPACKTKYARVKPARLPVFADAPRAPGRAEKPATKASDFPIGGSTGAGRVMLDGKVIEWPSFPVKADQDRVAHVLVAIAKTLPPRRYVEGD